MEGTWCAQVDRILSGVTVEAPGDRLVTQAAKEMTSRCRCLERSATR